MLERTLLTIKEVAEILGISARTIYNRVGIKSKKPFPIHVVRIGRSVRFRRGDVYDYIESL